MCEFFLVEQLERLGVDFLVMVPCIATLSLVPAAVLQTPPVRSIFLVVGYPFRCPEWYFVWESAVYHVRILTSPFVWVLEYI